MAVLAANNWSTNASLISDVARLGYLEGHVLDATYGRGRWWTRWEPEKLTAHDLALDGADFRALPEPDGTFDAVAFDPPYKLNGTPVLGDFDDAYGIAVSQTPDERHALICEGITECARVLRVGGHLLVKCQDQVVSGAVRWQTDEFTAHATKLGLVKVDRFHLLNGGRKQNPGRGQQHARNNFSTLLVFRKRWRDGRLRGVRHRRGSSRGRTTE
jgi:hypothetical protein